MRQAAGIIGVAPRRVCGCRTARVTLPAQGGGYWGFGGSPCAALAALAKAVASTALEIPSARAIAVLTRAPASSRRACILSVQRCKLKPEGSRSVQWFWFVTTPSC